MDSFFKRSLTLIELLVAAALIGLLVVGISSLDSYFRFHLTASDRRVQIQNELAFVLEDMGKNVVRATGNVNDPIIVDLTPASNGFRVKVDVSDPNTWIEYTRSGNKIQRKVGTGSAEDLNRGNIILDPTTEPTKPVAKEGFIYSVISDAVTGGVVGIYVSLIARYDPTQNTSLDNPEIATAARFYSRSASSR